MPFFHLNTFALLFLPAIATAQELTAVQEPAKETPTVAVSEPLLAIPEGFAQPSDRTAASKLLLAIANAQFQAEQPHLVDGIQLELYLKERQDGNASEVGFELLYMVAPREVIAIGIDDADRGTMVQKGFDGKDYWLVEGDKEKLILSGHQYGKDRESIDEALDLCADLMLMLDFRQLEQRNTPQTILSHLDGRRILVGDLNRQAGNKWHYHLWLGAGSLQPFRLELAREVAVVPEADAQGAAAGGTAAPGVEVATTIEYQRFELGGYQAFKGRFIPRLVEMFRTPYTSNEDLPVRILQIRRFEWMSPDTK